MFMKENPDKKRLLEAFRAQTAQNLKERKCGGVAPLTRFSPMSKSGGIETM